MEKILLFFKTYYFWIKLMGIYILVMNIIGFILMGVDKKRARQHQWRIPEKHLFWTAILGGAIGSIGGMKYFHHKTLHRRFSWGLPFILIVQIGLIIYILMRLKPIYFL